MIIIEYTQFPCLFIIRLFISIWCTFTLTTVYIRAVNRIKIWILLKQNCNINVNKNMKVFDG